MRLILLATLPALLPVSSLLAQPYYSAKKGINCSACHVNPAGTGMRIPSPSNPTKINDAISFGADFRFLFSKVQGGSDSTFAVARNALYLLAEPVPSLSLLYNYNEERTAEMYALAKMPGDLPAYLRAGRFFVPYGLQLNDPKNSGLTRIAPFSPTAGFSLSPTQSDTGVEFGLSPKSGGFFNLSITNNAPNSGGANTNSKALTGRGGFVAKPGTLGATFFRGKNSDASTGRLEERYGLFGWTRFGPLILVGEGGWGVNTSNADSTKTRLQAVSAEVDYELLEETLLVRGIFDHLDPNTTQAQDSRSRYIFGAEWFALKYLSLETQIRILTETPSISNNEALALTHIWF